MNTYEWAVVGSGIAGIATAEILTREGHSVILIEKNDSLASETTREFHEWLHTGSLYTLVPDRLKTLRYILGAVDDLIEFYSAYNGMNLVPTDKGLKINTIENGWFDSNHIYFKYRIKGRKITLPWLYGVARSIYLIEKIFQHDWLRRRAGELIHYKIGRTKRVLSLIKELVNEKEEFKLLRTPDFTINSRKLLRDLVAASINNGLEISTENEITKIENCDKFKILHGTKENIKSENVAFCNGSGIKSFTEVKTTTSYAPIAVVSGVGKEEKSFVELDYFPKNCINLLTKEIGFGLAGGISLSDKEKCNQYLDFVIKKHQKLNPAIREESRYIGVKTEITFNKQPRGYLYHIVNPSQGIWAIVPGKFTLAFSMAPEFYRQVYHKNPRKHFKPVNADINQNNLVSNTIWLDTINVLGK